MVAIWFGVACGWFVGLLIVWLFDFDFLVGLVLLCDLIVLVLQFFAYLPDAVLNLLVWCRYSAIVYCFGLMLVCCLNLVVVLVGVAVPAFDCFGLGFVISGFADSFGLVLAGLLVGEFGC